MEKNEFWLISGSIYRVIGDFSEVETPLDYELRNVENDNDEFTISEVQAKQNIKNGKWKRIALE